MGNCKYCGGKAGFLRGKHKNCEAAYQPAGSRWWFWRTWRLAGLISMNDCPIAHRVLTNVSKIRIAIAAILMLSVVGLACGTDTPEPIAPVATTVPSPTETPETPATQRPTPMPMMQPTATLQPTATATLEPTATPRPTATATPRPTATPRRPPTPTRLPTAQPTRATERYNFQNCTKLREVFPHGVPKGHPAYQPKMDRDGDDWACERS